MAQSGTATAARLFFGVPAGDALRAALGVLAQAIAAQAHGRAVPATNLHATLAFLGSVARTRQDELCAIGATLDAQSCEVMLDRLGSFRGARVAWIGTALVPAPLAALQARLADRLAGAGWTLDSRPFNLHVTLARHCRVALPPRAVAALAWRVDEIALFESIGTPHGPRYEPLAAWPMG